MAMQSYEFKMLTFRYDNLKVISTNSPSIYSGDFLDEHDIQAPRGNAGEGLNKHAITVQISDNPYFADIVVNDDDDFFEDTQYGTAGPRDVTINGDRTTEWVPREYNGTPVNVDNWLNYSDTWGTGPFNGRFNSQWQGNSLRPIVQGEPQVLGSAFVGKDGNPWIPSNGVSATAGTIVSNLGGGILYDSNGNPIGNYRILAQTDQPASAYGIITDTPLLPGAIYTFGPLSYADDKMAYEAIQTEVPCLTSGTLIDTKDGQKLVEHLRPGDYILTASGECKPLLLVCSSRISAAQIQKNPKLSPVIISAGALGNGLPKKDLRVSRQHRILITDCDVQGDGINESLVAAIRLVDIPGVRLDEECQGVTYYHLVFEKHEVIYAEGYPVESLYFGKEAMKSIPPQAKEELAAIFPELLNDMEGLDELNARRAEFIIPENSVQKAIARNLAQKLSETISVN